mgnify:CR=1
FFIFPPLIIKLIINPYSGQKGNQD